VRRLIALGAILALAAPVAAHGSSRLRLKTVVHGLSFPTALAAPARNRHDIYVGERAGRVVLVRDGHRRKRPFLDLRTVVSRPHANSEDGFLSLAFAPGFAKNRRLYVSYSTRHDTERLDEWRANRSGTHVVSGSRRKLLELPHPEAHHYGGDLHFGPDGYLYVSVGDGGESTHGVRAQDLSSVFGKILRIDPRRASDGAPYRIPPGNPFAGTPGARPEIWLYGVRNPWRFSFTPRGDLIVGDVGEQQREEVDWLRGPHAGRGANLGWACREGSIAFEHAAPDCSAPGALSPSFDYSHFAQKHPPTVKPGRRVRPPAAGHRAPESAVGCTGAVTGGYAVRDPQLRRYRGRYVFGDYCAGTIYYAARASSGRLRVYGLRQDARFALVSFGEDGCGRLYAVHITEGTVKRLQYRRSRCVKRQ
jgi:hypothetical protein